VPRATAALATLLALATSCSSPEPDLDQQAQFTVRGRWPTAAEITYRLKADDSPIGAAAFRRAVERATREWTLPDRIGFRPAGPDEPADVTLSFERGHHGACTPFGPNADVAHTGPVAPGTFIHFDLDREWSENGETGVSVFHTALHELGHVLGLGHSEPSAAVMSTDPRRPGELSWHDRAGLHSLYGGGRDGNGDLVLGSTILHRVAPSANTGFAAFDTNGDGRDELLVWRTDAAGNGSLLIYHFAAGPNPQGPLLTRTLGPFLGTVAAGADVAFANNEDGARYLVCRFEDGRVMTRQFDHHGLPAMPRTPPTTAALEAATRSSEGLFDGEHRIAVSRRPPTR